MSSTSQRTHNGMPIRSGGMGKRKGYAEGGKVDNGLPKKIMFPREGIPFNYQTDGDPREFMFGQRIKPITPAPGGSDDGKSRGGKITRTAGPPIGKDDGLIPAQKGEFVVRKRAVEKVGVPALNALNRSGSSPKSAAEAMADRKRQGLTYREVAGEHGVSKSTAHRKARGLLRNGFTREGSAF